MDTDSEISFIGDLNLKTEDVCEKIHVHNHIIFLAYI